MTELKVELTTEPISESKKEPTVMETTKNLNSSNLRKTIHSHELLQNGKEVFILHKGHQYHLQCTRNGKLILTK